VRTAFAQVSLLTKKSLGLAPPLVTPFPSTVMSVSPVFVIVTVWVPPVVPTCWPPNVTGFGLKVAGLGVFNDTATPETSPAVSTKRIRGSRRCIFSGS